MNYKKFLAAASAALMIIIVILMLAPGSWAQSTYKTLYSFKRYNDGKFPKATGGLVFDTAGNLYGTTWEGGTRNRGTVFMLSPNSDGSWTESVLYSFCSLKNCTDGEYPYSNLIFDQAGNLYGTTSEGGT